MIHVKSSAMQDRPLCGFDSGQEPMAWTTRESMIMMATCPECIHEVLVEKCGACAGRGTIQDYDEEWPCKACDGEAFVDHRDAEMEKRRASGGGAIGA